MARLLLRLNPQRACIGSNIACENATTMFRLGYTNGSGQEVDFAVIPEERKQRGVPQLRIPGNGAIEAPVVGKDHDVHRDRKTSLSVHVLPEPLLGVM